MLESISSMNSLDSLQAPLNNICRELNLPLVQSSLKPVLHDSGWFLSSELCLLIARRVGQNPEGLAELFLDRLPRSSQGSWSRIAGYLAFTLGEASDLVADFQLPIRMQESLRIFVPARTAQLPRAGYVRLASLALLQGFWAMKSSGRVEVTISGEPFTEELLRGDLCGALRHLIECSAREADPSVRMSDAAITYLREDLTCRYSLFFSPGEIEPAFFRRGAELLSFDEQVSVVVAERGWLNDLDPLPHDFSNLGHDHGRAYALLLHLAGDSRGVDIEWRSAEFLERKNLCWVMRSLVSRLEVLQGGPLTFGGALNPVVVDGSAHQFLVRFLPLFFERAVRFGEVIPYTSALGAVCDSLSFSLNRPDFRIALERGAPGAVATLAGLNALTGMLRALFFDVDRSS